MMKHALQLSCILMLFVVTGCIDATTVVSVNKDGSGSVYEVAFFGKAIDQMIQQMTAAFGGQTVDSQLSTSFVDIENCKAKAAQLGEGVRFVFAKELKKQDGTVGFGAVYAFDDIRKLKISSDPDIPGQKGTQTTKESSPITFDFIKGPKPKLIINMPRRSNAEIKTHSMGSDAIQNPSPEQMAQMKQMFDGFRVRVMVKVHGEITSTNASYVQIDSKSDKKQFVTLLDMNIGEIIQHEELCEKIAAMGQIQDMETASEKLKGISGLKIETAQMVEVDFH